MEESSVAADPLAQAIDALTLKNLGLLKARVEVDPESVLGVNGNELTVQLKWGASKSQHVQVEDKVTKKANQFFIVEIATSLRMVEKAQPGQPEMSVSSEINLADPKVRAEVEATFVVTYDLDHTHELGPTALDVFARRNVIYHVWPYWRAYITDTLGRANMPPFVLPMFNLARQSQQLQQLQKRRGEADLSKINLTEPSQLQFWMKELGVDESELRALVQEGGEGEGAIREHPTKGVRRSKID